MNVEIREMNPNDWESVAKIYSQGLLLGESTFQTECPTYDEWDKGHLNECRYVVTKDDLVIGWTALSPTSSRQVYKGVVEVSIYIDEKYRGTGLGSMLLGYICNASEEKGYYSLYASIFEINKASYHMNLKNGFREVGLREKIAKDRFGNWQNTIIMERRSRKIL